MKKLNPTFSLLVFVAIVSLLMGMRYANRVTDEIALQQTQEKTFAQDLSIESKTDDGFILGNPMDVTYVFLINGQERRVVRCVSNLFISPKCIVYPGKDPVGENLRIQEGVDILLLLEEEPR